jgi:hypothetical protein
MEISGTSEVLGPLDRAKYEHIVTIERPGDRPVTNVLIDGHLWAAITDELLYERLGTGFKGVERWAENVVKNLLHEIQRGTDLWSDDLTQAKFDFLMRCAP